MNIDTQLPESGTGFVTNNRGDHGQFQFGQQAVSIPALLSPPQRGKLYIQEALSRSAKFPNQGWRTDAAASFS